MQPTLCTRCKKRVAVVFISKIEKGETINEGLCLKCAKDLGLPQEYFDYVYAYMCTACIAGAYSGQKMLDPMELELQTAVSC